MERISIFNLDPILMIKATSQYDILVENKEVGYDEVYHLALVFEIYTLEYSNAILNKAY